MIRPREVLLAALAEDLRPVVQGLRERVYLDGIPVLIEALGEDAPIGAEKRSSTKGGGHARTRD